MTIMNTNQERLRAHSQEDSKGSQQEGSKDEILSALIEEYFGDVNFGSMNREWDNQLLYL